MAATLSRVGAVPVCEEKAWVPKQRCSRPGRCRSKHVAGALPPLQVLDNSLEARVLQSDNSALAKDCRKEMKALNTRLLKLGASVWL